MPESTPAPSSPALHRPLQPPPSPVITTGTLPETTRPHLLVMQVLLIIPRLIRPFIDQSLFLRTMLSHAPPSQPAYQQVYYQNTSPVSYAAPVSRGLGHGASYKTYTLDPNAQLVLPPVRPGETYVIVPPAGRKVEVVYDPASGSRSSRTSRSPTKKTGKPLLKRLLTLGSSADKGSSSSSRRDRRVSY
ncbi:unnamed protein product [Somion occarium]|uniref:DUF4774 domain-containing protein n=1 Tax=Somion occarium TaxID=3059160 RepID=A0ABP1CVL7_9APHY